MQPGKERHWCIFEKLIGVILLIKNKEDSNTKNFVRLISKQNYFLLFSSKGPKTGMVNLFFYTDHI